MKSVGSLIFLLAVCSVVNAQQSTLLSSIAGVDRMSVVKTSIAVPSWNEKSFWPLYEQYRENINDKSLIMYRALDQFAHIGRNTSDEEALAQAQQMLASRTADLAVKREYYEKITQEFNGVVSFQFLQTEMLLDMMESAGLYEQTRWKNFRFHPTALSSPDFRRVKYSLIANAVELPEEKAEDFYWIYSRYEEDCNDLLGENYDIVGLYAGEPSDYTPAIAKQLGSNLLTILERENKLKEKYFKKMSEEVGASLASRFLAWEDYYSLISKMSAWADTP
ncbi:hypothetical protein [Chryseosolibacter indicus]|uniref:Uncharacterized protein n=1 Tax=Chryseosolibacter indicus TaxID=2782351 RepID=A0ABS5VYG6_9BACT|nr:hypothetical protein [Chryseosolibacter indicus]MBT1705046.1 hypothetical protein [Chryseosolibacter indicus]